MQREACILGMPCVTLRDNTERPETIEVGANVLAGAGGHQMMKKAMLMMQRGGGGPFGMTGNREHNRTSAPSQIKPNTKSVRL
nr:UDP-N-acetylglucosamine 2-epimerase [Methanothrix sp.]